MLFTPAEQKERHRFADASVRSAIWALGIEGTAERVDQGYLSAIRGIIENQCFVPNIRHGIVSVPRTISDTDRVPIVPLYPEESVRFTSQDYLLPTQSQIVSCGQIMESWAVEPQQVPQLTHGLNMWVAASRKQRNHLKADFPLRARAVVNISPLHHLGLGNLLVPGEEALVLVGSRPKMILPMLPGTLRKSPSTIVHEAVHIDQALKHPLLLPSEIDDHTWRSELEAHGLGAIIDTALLENGYEPSPREEFDASYMKINGVVVPMSTSILIDTIRIKTNEGTNDPYFPNDVLKQRVIDLGLDFSYKGGDISES